jgi:hypothetical protein
MPETSCYVCNLESTISDNPDHLRKVVSCPRCQKYEIFIKTAEKIKNNISQQQIANISSWIYHNDKPIIDQNNIENLLNLPTATVGEKARRFITYVAKQYPKPGDFIKNIHADDTIYLTMTGCYDRTELGYIIKDYLSVNQEYLLNFNDSDNRYSFKISPQGWAYIESLKELNPDSHIGFIAMWFNKQLDSFFHDIEEAIRDAKYQPLRLDRKEHNNNIDDEIIATIRQSKFIVADFTGQRGGVYFEAGFAKGLGLEVIYLCEESDFENVHFDNRQSNFIIWNKDNLDQLRKKLTDRIIATIGKGSYNPQIQ